MAGYLSIFTSCTPKPDYGIRIDTPQAASSLSTALVINGRYADANSALTGVRVELARDSDNLFWSGATWGPAFSLAASLNTSNDTWQCTSTLPSGAALADGWYRITAYADFTGHAPERADTIFSVGITPPPVLPALYGWGNNHARQLGAGLFDQVNYPVPVFMRGVLDGKIVVAVSTGYAHTLVCTSEGRVYAWGSNSAKQLGLGAGTPPIESVFPVAVDDSDVLSGKKIESIAAGSNHSLASDNIGRVFSWGDNSSGELGNGSTGGEVSQPLQVGGMLAGKTVTRVAAGAYASFALADGKVYAWGRNDMGQLGNGGNADSNTPVAVTGLDGT